jgi:pimeloyl-ACP methyl ester carboxylesterase
VSRGGRPDLVLDRLPEVKAPTLLLVGGSDDLVLELNREALNNINFGKLTIVPGAGHLFEEPGALEYMTECAKSWFIHYFTAKSGKKYRSTAA